MDHDTGLVQRRRQAEYQDDLRLQQYDDLFAAFDGQQWRRRPQPAEVQLVFNYLRVFIRKLASYHMGVPPQYRVTRRGASSDVAPVEELLARTATYNRLPALDLATAQSAGILGDGCYTLRWDAAAGLPRITAVDPAAIRCRYRGDDLRTLLWLRHQYYVYPGELPAATQAQLPEMPYDKQVLVTETWTPRTWQREIVGLVVESGRHPYGAIPYLVFPNERLPGLFWGASDLEDLIDPQAQLNARMSDLERLLSLSGNPVTVTVGVSADSDLAVGPGSHWPLPADAQAYILNMLEGGVVQSHLLHIDALYRTLHDLAELPRTSFGDTSGQGAKSGVALQLELQPLIHKLARKRAIWTDVLIQRAEWVIRMANIAGAGLPAVEDLTITLTWPPVIPSDRTDQVNQETALVGANIHSRLTASRLVGDDDPAAEQAQVAQEQQAQASRDQASARIGGFANG